MLKEVHEVNLQVSGQMNTIRTGQRTRMYENGPSKVPTSEKLT